MTFEAIYKRKIKKKTIITSQDDTYRLTRRFTKSRQEQCIVITLDKGMVVIGVHLVNIGTRHTTPISQKEIFYKAILDNAERIIVCHNHSDDTIEPSKTDLKMADKLYKSGTILDIIVSDQLIISQYGYTSMRPSLKSIINGEIRINDL
jgi:DNA repair protein RadC